MVGRERCYTPSMHEGQLRALLRRLQDGEIDVEQAVSGLAHLPFVDLEFARVDHHRTLRQGIPEVVFAEGKTPEQVLAIVHELLDKEQGVLVTRTSSEQRAALAARFPVLEIDPSARTALALGRVPSHRARARVVVITAGTSDLPVAGEALETLRACGISAARLNDVGVAGLHRLLPEVERVRAADVVLVIAGMEGALASVIGGLVAAPVIAVPTSVGYGAAFEGVAALLGMLTSCAAGVSVVNIDNGFGAAIAAVRMVDRFSGERGSNPTGSSDV